jgi:6-phosphogluconolactonase/glucosamine-6-phosphate isomerase/deaminase
LVDVIVVDSLGEPVGRRWCDAQASKIATAGRFFLAAPLSSTPLPIFEWVVAHPNLFQGWDQMEFVLMDEQLEGYEPPFEYVRVDDPASYEGFARKHLLDPLADRTSVAIPIVKPDAKLISEFTTRIDLLILAIGVKGNFANVMPGTPLELGWHVSHLTPEFRQVHTARDSKSYGGAVFREYGMSLGPQQALEAGEVIVIASGARKRVLVGELVSATDFTPDFPLSVVHHPDVRSKTTLYVTPDAYPE